MKDKIQTRREFFKGAVKTSLPILGAIMMSSPIITQATNVAMNCQTGCFSVCRADCYSDCDYSCGRGCQNSCDTTCKGSCRQTCRGECKRSNE